MIARTMLFTLLAFCLPAVPEASEPRLAEKPFSLMVGDPAPPLSVSRWIRGGPISGFRKGQVYVLDFWASWCQPCIAEMPHMTELQRKHGGRVTVIGMNVWEPRPPEAEALVRTMDDKLAYAVAMDQVAVPPGKEISEVMYDGKMAVDWLKASGKALDGIPQTFVVDGSGRIAWIGEPAKVDDPLARIVAGQWDLGAEAVRYRAAMAERAKSASLETRLQEAMQSRDWTAAVQACDGLIALDREKFADRAGLKFFLLLTQMKQPDEAYAYGRQVVETFEDKPSVLNRIAWTIVNPKFEIPRKDLDLARKAASRARELTGGKDPEVFRTLARVSFAEGDVQEAIELQARAVELAQGEAKPGFQETLDEYRKAAAGKG